VVAHSGLPTCKAHVRGFSRVYRPEAAARSLRRRRYAHYTVRSSPFPHIFGVGKAVREYEKTHHLFRGAARQYDKNNYHSAYLFRGALRASATKQLSERARRVIRPLLKFLAYGAS